MGTTIELVHDRFLTGIVCCDVNPTDKNAFDEVDRLCKGLYNGTTNGWRTVREEDCIRRGEPWDDTKPIPCEDYPNRWHYVVLTQFAEEKLKINMMKVSIKQNN